jgi:serine/threonine protein kinase
MNPQRWQIINDIFQAAVELPDTQREAYLRERCDGDEELRAEVESLLHCDQQADTFIAEPAMKAAAAMLADDLPKLHIEQSVDHYQVIRQLGKGGMGEIYLAQDRKLERKVALKLLHIPFTGDHQRLQHFLKEARSISALNHPNIIIVHAVELEGDEPYIVTEFIEGETLRQRLSRQPMTLEEALNVVLQIGSALEAAHRAGVVHRDIKPENVMIRPDGIVKVLDFGLAKLSGEQPRYSLAAAAGNGEESDPGRFMGTIRYMSPEQARGEEVDARADIFSLGVVLYEMVVGKPGAGQSDSTLIARLLSDEPFYRYESKPDLPAGIEPIIAKATNKDRAQRYVTVSDFLHDLQAGNFTVRETDMIPAQGEHGSDLLSSIIEFFRQKTATAFALLLVASLLVVGTIVVARIYFPTHKPQPESRVNRANFDFFKVLAERGNLVSPYRFSPDGSLIALVKFNQNIPQIYISQLDSERLTKVTPDGFDARTPVFSPDGQEIAFVSNNGGTTGIWLVPVADGSPRLLETPSLLGVQLLTWTKTNHLYFKAEYCLFRFDLDSHQIDKIFSNDAKNWPSYAVSADEKQIAFAALTDGRRDIWVAPLQGGEARKITDDDYEDNTPIWFPDGKRLAYSSRRQGNFQVCIAYLDGSPPEQVTLGDADAFAVDVSSDSRFIVYESTHDDSRMFSVDLTSGREEPIISPYGIAFFPQISKDGRRLLYQQIPNASAQRNLDNAQIVIKELANIIEPSSKSQGYEPLFSSDGKQIAFLRTDNTTNNRDIFLMDVNSSEPRRLTTGGIDWTGFDPPYNPVDRANYGWSPDSRALVYGSRRDGVSNLYLSRADGSGEIKLSNNEDARLMVAAPCFTGTDMQIAYVLRPHHDAVGKVKNWQLRLHDDKTEEVLFSVERPIRLLGAHDGEVFFAVLEPASINNAIPAAISLMRYSQKAHTVKEIRKVNQAYLQTIFMSDDGRQIALVRKEEENANLYIVNLKNGSIRQLTNNRDPKLNFNNMVFSLDGKTIYFCKQQTVSSLNLLQSEERTKQE